MGIEGKKEPWIVEPLYRDPQTISEMAINDIVEIHNRAERGEISKTEAKDLMGEVEKMRVEIGDGWFDRYGPPPPEFDFLYEDEDRYWEREPGDR